MQMKKSNPTHLEHIGENIKELRAQSRISSMNQVDRIVVESENPIRTCATLRFADGTLEPAWAAQLDAEMEVTENDDNYFLLAQDLYNNWDAINIYTRDLLNFYEVSQYADAHPTYFLFLSTNNTGLSQEEIRTGYNVLDADGDSYISKEDLPTFVQRETYQTASEEERATDKYAAVFSEFQVPKSYGWYGWTPAVYYDGTVDVSQRGY